MSKPEYISMIKGLHTAKPNCFKCGDCCQILPVEITEQEKKLIAPRLKPSEQKLFLELITTNFAEANVIKTWIQDMPQFGLGWLKAPCMFLTWEKKSNKTRAHCSIYKIRPRMCRIFYCGKESKDEHLNIHKYTYKIDGMEDEHLKKILSDLRQQRP